MDEPSPFTKRHVEEVTAAKRTLLDELNLPPAAKKFIQDNSRLLVAALIAIVVAIVGWNYYSYYTATTNDRAAQQLSQAMLIVDMEQKAAALDAVKKDFAGTGSALWGQLILAGEYMELKEYAKALAILQPLHKDVGRTNPLFPLLQQLFGLAHELNNELAMALHYYQILSSLPGFSATGYLESGRVHELQQETAKAREAYGKAVSSADLKDEQRAWLQARLNTL